MGFISWMVDRCCMYHNGNFLLEETISVFLSHSLDYNKKIIFSRDLPTASTRDQPRTYQNRKECLKFPYQYLDDGLDSNFNLEPVNNFKKKLGFIGISQVKGLFLINFLTSFSDVYIRSLMFQFSFAWVLSEIQLLFFDDQYQ